MRLKKFKDAFQLLNIIEKRGYQAFLVGGCVRNYLLGMEIVDFDVTTSALPSEITKMFLKVIPVSVEHRTVIVFHEKEPYEVTTFRSELMQKQRNDSKVGSNHDLISDLQYRDFTMNAIAMNNSGEIIDPFHGRVDLQRGLIRTVGTPNERFEEDPLRMLRAIRFAAQFGFQIETNTLQAIKGSIKLIENVATERITNELRKMFQGKFVNKGLHYLVDTKIDNHLPIFKEHPLLISSLPENLTAFTSLAEVIALLHYKYPQITIANWIQKLKCSNAEKKTAQELFHLILEMEKSGLNKWLVYRLKPTLHKSFIHLSNVILHKSLNDKLIKQMRNELQILSRQELVIDGKDLISFFPEKKAGPWIENLLAKVEQEVIMNRLKNDYDTIKEWILCHPHEIN